MLNHNHRIHSITPSNLIVYVKLSGPAGRVHVIAKANGVELYTLVDPVIPKEVGSCKIPHLRKLYHPIGLGLYHDSLIALGSAVLIQLSDRIEKLQEIIDFKDEPWFSKASVSGRILFVYDPIYNAVKLYTSLESNVYPIPTMVSDDKSIAEPTT